MIDKATWKKLEKEWEKVGKVYQEPRRVEYRLKFFCEHALEYLKGKAVLEIGANAGVYSYCMTKVADAVIAVEPGNKIAKKPYKTSYYDQLRMTGLYVDKEEKYDDFFPVNETVEKYCQYPRECVYTCFNALVMSYVLYHLSNKEIDLLTEHILPKCGVVIIQTRNQKRPKKHNSYKFWKSDNVVKFFMSQGFTSREIVWEKDRKFSLEMFFKPSLYNKEASCNAQSASQPVKDSRLNTTKNAQANGTAPSATSPTP